MMSFYEVPDIVLETPQGKILVECKRDIQDADIRTILEGLETYVRRAHGQTPKFTVLVDLNQIRILRGLEPKPVSILVTSDILSVYDDKFRDQVIYESYLTSLVEGWLDDFAFGWKEKDPPGRDRLPEDLVQALAA